MERYSAESLADHVAANSDLVSEGLRSNDPRDRATIEKMRQMAAKYRRYREKIGRAVTVDWFLDGSRWIWRQPPRRLPNGRVMDTRAYYAILSTPQGRRWLERNLRSGIDYFFGP